MNAKVKTPRLNHKADILDAAVALARENGLRNFSRLDVAKRAKIASSTVSYHYNKMLDLVRAVVEVAIDQGITSILADVRADRNRSELYTSMPPELIERVAAYIAR